MKIHVLLSPQNVDELYFTGKTVVIIDVLRATTVVAHALKNGAKEIIPVGSIDFAMKISGNAHGGQTLLCGERNTKMIEGFNLGNSPAEYTSERVNTKSIIFFTTNGSKSVVKAKFADNLFTCSFNNLSAIAKHLAELNEDVEILCAGSNGMFCVEDTVCAGRLITELVGLKEDITITDAAKASVVLSKEFGVDLVNMLKDCEHGKRLVDNGFESDIEICGQLSNVDVVPVFLDGALKVLPKNMAEEK